MNQKQHSLTWRLLLAGWWSIFAVALTTQSHRVPLVGLMADTIGGTAGGAAFGHATLFGVMTAVLYLLLALWLPRRYALALALGAALLVGTGTEFFQILVADRDASLADLLANWLGVFVIAFMITFATTFTPSIAPQKSR